MPATHKILAVLALPILLAACATGTHQNDGGHENFYAQRIYTPAGEAFQTPGTNGGYASSLSCDAIASELNTVGREMGQVAANTFTYKDNPNNLQFAEYITNTYDNELRYKELDLNPWQLKQMSHLVNEYHSLRYVAYERRCPVTAALDESHQWAAKEGSNGWRQLDRFTDFIGNVTNIADGVSQISDDAKDW